jgi:hypothetical protein
MGSLRSVAGRWSSVRNDAWDLGLGSGPHTILSLCWVRAKDFHSIWSDPRWGRDSLRPRREATICHWNRCPAYREDLPLARGRTHRGRHRLATLGVCVAVSDGRQPQSGCPDSLLLSPRSTRSDKNRILTTKVSLLSRIYARLTTNLGRRAPYPKLLCLLFETTAERLGPVSPSTSPRGFSDDSPARIMAS